MTGRVVPREVQARILDDLARGHRPVSAIADRLHLTADQVRIVLDAIEAA